MFHRTAGKSAYGRGGRDEVRDSPVVSENAQQWTVLEIGGQLFALEIERMEEIVDHLDITPAPGTPSFLLGLANLRGSILPVLDTHDRLGGGGGNKAPREYVLVRSGSRSMGIAVDRVLGILGAGESHVQPLSEAMGLGQGEMFVRGAFRSETYGALVLSLDIDSLCRFELPAALADRPASSRLTPIAQDPGSAPGQKPEDAGGRMLSFEVAGTEYGLALEHLLRIIPYAPPVVTPHRVPGVAGMVADGGQTLPVLDLRQLLGPDAGAKVPGTLSRYILVLTMGGRPVGLAVDRLRKIMAARGSGSGNGTGTDLGSPVKDIIRTDGGRQLLFVLNPEALLDSKTSVLLERFGGDGSMASFRAGPDAATGREGEEDEEQEAYVCFGLGDAKYAVPMNRVREVSLVGEVTSVPQAPVHIVGLVNLRGAILPAIDLRARLGLPMEEHSSRCAKEARILVAAIGDQLCGLLVDRVYKPLYLTRRLIEPLPGSCRVDDVSCCIQGVAKMDGGESALLLAIDVVIQDGGAETAARPAFLPDRKEAGGEAYA